MPIHVIRKKNDEAVECDAECGVKVRRGGWMSVLICQTFDKFKTIIRGHQDCESKLLSKGINVLHDYNKDEFVE